MQGAGVPPSPPQKGDELLEFGSLGVGGYEGVGCREACDEGG